MKNNPISLPFYTVSLNTFINPHYLLSELVTQSTSHLAVMNGKPAETQSEADLLH